MLQLDPVAPERRRSQDGDCGGRQLERTGNERVWMAGVGISVPRQVRRPRDDVVIAKQQPVAAGKSSPPIASRGGAPPELRRERHRNAPIAEGVDDPCGRVISAVVDDDHLVTIVRIVESEQRR